MLFPTSVQSTWLRPLRIAQIQPVAGGLSTARVWRLTDADGAGYCLKAWWAQSTSAERLAEVQRFLDVLRAADLPFVPKSIRGLAQSAYVAAEGWWWELVTWLPGLPDQSTCASLARRDSAAQALAAIHHCWRKVDCHWGISPAVQTRVALLRAALADYPEFAAVPQPWPKSDLARQTLTRLEQSAERLLQSLSELLQPIELHFAIRDVHSEHVLFVSDQVRGIVDYGAARVDEPLIDLVRLFGSLCPFDAAARRQALTSYHQERLRLAGSLAAAPPLDLSEWLLRFSVLDEASTLLSAVQWFRWLILQQRTFPGPPDRITARWRRLLERLNQRSFALL